MEKEIREAINQCVRLGWKWNGYTHSKVGTVHDFENDHFYFLVNGDLRLKIKYEQVQKLEVIRMKIAYIAHPINGDIKGNLIKIIEITRQINLSEPEVVPFAPYYADCIALDDNIESERERGIKNGTALFKKGFVIDELRLYGDYISKGMRAEIELAKQFNITIIPMTKPIIKEYLTLN